MANKIKYGLSNVFYSVITYGENGVESYGTPVAMPGAVNMSLSPEGETNPFYADNITYWTSTTNNGYTGTLELALVPDSFKTDVLGETADTAGVIFENANTPTKEFALLFQFEGDDKATKHAMYRCVATRPEVSSSTKEAGITPVTETLNITAMARISDHVVKSECKFASSAYATWFDGVYLPA